MAELIPHIVTADLSGKNKDKAKSLKFQYTLGDTDSHQLNISLVNGDDAVILDDITAVTLTFKKADNNTVTAIAVKDIDGTYYYKLQTSETSYAGEVIFTVEVYKGLFKATSNQFIFEVIDDLDNGSVSSTTVYPVLTSLIEDVNKVNYTFISKGEWIGATKYDKYNNVIFEGESFRSKVDDNLGQQPKTSGVLNSAFWELVAAKGIQGIQGIQGTPGGQGIQGIQGIQGVKGDTGQGLHSKGDWVSGVVVNENEYVYDRSTADIAIKAMWVYKGTVAYTSNTAPYLDTANFVEFAGIKGDQGIQGLQGEQGNQGIQGIQGEPGTPGPSSADGISITDTASNFIAEDVEGALAELFQSVSDGKTLLETAVTDMNGVVSKAGAIATFNELDTGIRSIETGTDTTDATATVENILQGTTAYIASGKGTGTLPNRGTVEYTPTNVEQLMPDGFYQSSKVKAITIQAGDLTWVSADTEIAFNQTTYTKKHEIKIDNVGGSVRVSFDLSGAAGQTTYGRIYKNGIAIGIERTVTSAAYTTFIEDITFNDHDLIQLYVKTTGGTCYYRYFRLKTSIDYALPTIIL